MKNAACVSKTCFLLKTLSARFCTFPKFVFKSLQKFNSSIHSVLFDSTFQKIIYSIDKNSLQMQTRINVLDQFHSRLHRKQLFSNQEKFRKICENFMFKMNNSD